MTSLLWQIMSAGIAATTALSSNIASLLGTYSSNGRGLIG